MLRRKKTVNIAVSARTGKLASSVRTISIAYVPLFVPEDSHLIDVKSEGSNAMEFKLFDEGGGRWGSRPLLKLEKYSSL
jgi:hypothetical protein